MQKSSRESWKNVDLSLFGGTSAKLLQSPDVQKKWKQVPLLLQTKAYAAGFRFHSNMPLSVHLPQRPVIFI